MGEIYNGCKSNYTELNNPTSIYLKIMQKRRVMTLYLQTVIVIDSLNKEEKLFAHNHQT